MAVDSLTEAGLINSAKGLCKEKKFQKSKNTMEVGGWVQVSIRIFCVENYPKIALNQYRYFGVVYVFCLYTHC